MSELSIRQAATIFFAFMLVFGVAQAQDVRSPIGGTELRVMSYNINGLPWPLKANKAPLFKEMARIINDQRVAGTAPHIILVQEGFRGNSRHFVEGSGYPYIAKGPNSKQRDSDDVPSKALINSGLFVMSEYPIVKVDKVVFGSQCTGWDCMANKGVLYAQIDIPGIGLVDVFNTHFNSVGSSGSKKEKVYAVQAQQLQIAIDFIKANTSSERPALFVGDVNIRESNPVFPTMMASLQPLFHTGTFCKLYTSFCSLGEGTGIQELFETPDHHFYKSSDQVEVYPYYSAKTMRSRVDDRGLSDHLAYLAYYTFKK